MQSNLDSKSRAGAVINIFFKHAIAYPWLFSAVVLGTIGIQAASLAAPLYLRTFFNLLASKTPSAQIAGELLSLLVIIAFVLFFEWIARRTFTFSIVRLEAMAMADLYSTAFDYLIGHSYHFFISQFAGTLTRRVSKFTHAFETLFDAIMMSFFPTFLFVVGVDIVLFIRNETLGLILAAWVIFFIIFQFFVARLRQPIRNMRSEEDSRMVGALADSISNQTTVTLFSGLEHEYARFKLAVSRWLYATMRSWNADEMIWAGQGFLTVVINVTMLYGAIIFWRQGLLTIGDFVLIQTYLLGTFNRLDGINREFRRIYDAFADGGEMVEILTTPHEIQDILNAPAIKIYRAEINIKNINFHFHENRPVLNNFNLKIDGGEKVALVGPSGAGKTTVTKLLLRLYDVRSGSIEIDGQNISRVTQESLRNSIAFVPQEPILFHRTLMDNIRYGKRDAIDEEVVDAAKKAHADEFIRSLPDGYNTYVGERGVKLSGGERQRVAIARAILKNSPILILDEATSSLDSESEALIQDALQTLMQGKTVVVIAHRLSTIMKMDRILVIDNGKIIDEGTHAKLLQKEGLYKKLWSIQAGGFLTETEPAVEEKEISEEIAVDDIEDSDLIERSITK